MENKDRIKILYIITLSESGGAQRYILDLTMHLNDKFEIVVAAGGNEQLFNQLEKNEIKNVKLKHLIRNINPLKDLLSLVEIYHLIKKQKPDILHLNSSKAGVLGAVAGKLTGVKKIIYTVHGFVFNEPMPAWKKSLYIWLEKFSAKFKKTLICVSEFDQQQGLKYKIAPPKKLIIVHNGINVSALNFLSKEEAKKILTTTYHLPPTNYQLIGTIANFYPAKGLLYFIQAAHQVVKRHPDAHFVIIGDGELRPALKTEIKKLQLENNFHLIGAINNAAQLLPSFDIYVCPSIKEGFPYSILEAMAAGLPIVATNVGGIPEMITDQKEGILVKAKDVNALASSILKLINDKKNADKLASVAVKKVRENFSLEKMILETKKIYSL